MGWMIVCSSLAGFLLVVSRLPCNAQGLSLFGQDNPAWIRHKTPSHMQSCGGVKRGTAIKKGRSYLKHVPCDFWGSINGLGYNVELLRPAVSLAVDNNLTYLCQADEWNTAHQTGNLGYLFGCDQSLGCKKGGIHGDMADARDASRMLSVGQRGDLMPNGVVKPNRVYIEQSCQFGRKWGSSRDWFRSQYHLVRTRDPTRQEPACWNRTAVAAANKTVVVLALRAGDVTVTVRKRIDSFLETLKRIFNHDPHVTRTIGLELDEARAHIVVISEISADHDGVHSFDRFEKATVSYFLGEQERNPDLAQARFVRDLDCMTQADIFIGSNSGFSELAAALQLEGGLALFPGGSALRQNAGALPNQRLVVQDMPNMLYIPNNDDDLDLSALDGLANVKRIRIAAP